MRATGPLGVRRHAPSSSTIRRLLTLVCPGGLADLLGRDPTGNRHLAVDGRTARGSRTDPGPAAHLLSAVLEGGRTVSQLRVPDNTTEVTGFTKLLSPFGLAGVVVTSRRCTRVAFAAVQGGDRPPLRPRGGAQATWDPLGAHPHRHQSRAGLPARGAGREAPPASHHHKTGKITRETVHAITDLTARAASPQAIGQLARAQWGTEAVHHVRDTTFGKDASTIRTRHRPKSMATLRSFTISTLRTAGHHSTASGLRKPSYPPFTPPPDLIRLP